MGGIETAAEAEGFQTYLEEMASSTVNILPLSQNNNRTNRSSSNMLQRVIVPGSPLNNWTHKRVFR